MEEHNEERALEESSSDGQHDHENDEKIRGDHEVDIWGWPHREEFQEDRFNEFLFGSGRMRRQREGQEQGPRHPNNQQGIYIDYEQLLTSIDSLMESTKNLKPLFQRMFPFLQQIWKKK